MPELNPIPTRSDNMTSSTTNLGTVEPRAIARNDPYNSQGKGAKPSSIGATAPDAYTLRKVLRDLASKRKFTALADPIDMPKNSGQRITAYHLLPILHDMNQNDQGIDAKGAQIKNGNLFGSSKDAGKITAALPTLTENGGRVNRVGFTRRAVEGSFHPMGIFYEWTKTFADTDHDPNIISEMFEEAMIAAETINEMCIQLDIIGGAGTVIYAGSATSKDAIDHTGVVTWNTFSRLSAALDEAKSPRKTRLLTGTTMVDTRTTSMERIMFVSPRLRSTLENMTNNFGQPALIPVHAYAANANFKPMEDELGIINRFRIVEVEDMAYWAGVGATEDASKGIWATGGKYDVYPMVTIGEEAFSTIGFSVLSGKGNTKFKVITKKPGEETASAYDPYGQIGFTSIYWNYGILIKRPERIGMILTAAKY